MVVRTSQADSEKGELMDKPILYRKRLIPQECVLLKDDVILECSEDIILTKWCALKPKNICTTAIPAIFRRKVSKSANSIPKIIRSFTGTAISLTMNTKKTQMSLW